jgi:hypothetical protein
VAAADYVYAVRLDDVGLVAEPAHGAPRSAIAASASSHGLGCHPGATRNRLSRAASLPKAPPEPAGARSGEFPKPRPRDPFSRLGGRLVERADLVEEPLPILQDPLRALLGPLVVRVGRELPPAKISKVRELSSAISRSTSPARYCCETSSKKLTSSLSQQPCWRIASRATLENGDAPGCLRRRV